MNVTERDRLAAAIIAWRPDWASNGIDRHKAMRTWLTDNLMDWAIQDAALALTLVALDPTSQGPARMLTDGPWKRITRFLAGTTDQPLTAAELGGDCCICGVRKAVHNAANWLTRLSFDGIAIEQHDWVKAPEHTYSTPRAGLRNQYREDQPA